MFGGVLGAARGGGMILALKGRDIPDQGIALGTVDLCNEPCKGGT
jgi:hypothetical protein